jgi:hypothetical protein
MLSLKVNDVFKELAERILDKGAYKAIAFVSDTLVVKATRKRYNGKLVNRPTIDIVFTVGKPNFEERRLLKKAKEDNIVLTYKVKYIRG